MLIDTSLEKVFPSKARLTCFWEVATSFLLRSPPVCMWQQLLGHMASLERFLPRVTHTCPLQWCLKDHWSPMVDDCYSDPSVAEVLRGQVSVRCPSQGSFSIPAAAYGHISVGLGSPPVRSDGFRGVFSNTSMCWRLKLLFWLWQPFCPSLSGQCLILMSNNASVVAYLRNQGGTMSRVLCHMDAKVVLWTEGHSVSLTARYIPRKKNVLANQLSHPNLVIAKE